MLPLRPSKKQRIMTMNAASASPAVARSSASFGSNAETPLRSFPIGSRLVSPLLQETLGNPQGEDLSKSFKENLSNSQVHQDSSLLVKRQNKKNNRDELKAILQSNGQSVTGTVKVLMDRVSDGKARGKLGLCPQCSGGKLKVSDKNPHVVFCSRKLACGFQCSTETAPRCGPWQCLSFDKEETQVRPTAVATPERSIEVAPFERPSKKKRVSFGYSSTEQEKTIPADDPAESTAPNPWAYAPVFPSTPQQTYCPQFPPYRPSPCFYSGGAPPYVSPGYPMYGTGYMPYPPPPPYMGNHVPPTFAPPPGSQVPPPPELQRVAREGRQQSGSQWLPGADPAPFRQQEFVEPSSFPVFNDARANDNRLGLRPRAHSPAQVQMAIRAANFALGSNRGAGKRQWTPQEDAVVMRAVKICSSPFKGWSSLAQQLPGRSGKQIRDRWINHLNPALIHQAFSHEDDLLLWKGFLELGRSWKEISQRYFHSTRSENRIKNRWYSGTFKSSIIETIGSEAYDRAAATDEHCGGI